MPNAKIVFQFLFFSFFYPIRAAERSSRTEQRTTLAYNFSYYFLCEKFSKLPPSLRNGKWERSFGKAERVGGSTVSNKTANGQGSGNGKHTTPDKRQRKISFARWCNEGLYLSTHAYIYMYLQVSVAVSVSVALSLTVSADVAASMSQIQWLKSENHR